VGLELITSDEEIKYEAVIEQDAGAATIERGESSCPLHDTVLMIDIVSVEVTLSPARPAPASKRESLASPPRQRRGIKPNDIVIAEEAEQEAQARKMSSDQPLDLPSAHFGKEEKPASPLAQLRQKILDTDRRSPLCIREMSVLIRSRRGGSKVQEELG
jgi:hypothetical protein